MGDERRNTLVNMDVPSISCIVPSSRHLHFSFFLLTLVSNAFESSRLIGDMEVALLKAKHDGSIMDGKDYKIVNSPQLYNSSQPYPSKGFNP